MTEGPADGASGLARLLGGWWFLPLIGLVVVVMVALTSFSPQRTRIALTVRTQSITVRAMEDSSILAAGSNGLGTPLKPGQTARLTGRFTMLPEPVAPIDSNVADPSGTIEISLTGGTLNKLHIPPKANLTIELVPGGSVAYSGVAADLSADLSLRGIVIAAPPPARVPVAALGAAEIFGLTAWGNQALRLVLQPADPANLGIEDLQITQPRFSRPRLDPSDTRMPFRSEVTGGTLRLLDVARDVPLLPGDPVWLEDFTGHLARVTIDKGDLVADIIGTAHRVAVGPEIAQQDLTPSLLAWLIGQQSLTMLWGAVVAVCGVLAKLREWARANLK